MKNIKNINNLYNSNLNDKDFLNRFYILLYKRINKIIELNDIKNNEYFILINKTIDSILLLQNSLSKEFLLLFQFLNFILEGLNDILINKKEKLNECLKSLIILKNN